jgi:hypothetical protein
MGAWEYTISKMCSDRDICIIKCLRALEKSIPKEWNFQKAGAEHIKNIHVCEYVYTHDICGNVGYCDN